MKKSYTIWDLYRIGFILLLLWLCSGQVWPITPAVAKAGIVKNPAAATYNTIGLIQGVRSDGAAQHHFFFTLQSSG